MIFQCFWYTIINHCVCRRHTTFQIGTTHECTVRRLIVACHVQVALLLSFLAIHGLSGVPIGALLVDLQQWLLVASVRRTFLVG